VLDLHGQIADVALQRARHWLDAHRGPLPRTVRVVTGRGAHSAGPPVLRGEIGALLERMLGGPVREYRLESGQGAFEVTLAPRRPALAPRAPAASVGGADAELRRRAEAALWEVGVSPTPELLRAEMRRLRAEDEQRNAPG
jgi:hypothetical protein